MRRKFNDKLQGPEAGLGDSRGCTMSYVCTLAHVLVPAGLLYDLSLGWPLSKGGNNSNCFSALCETQI